jgi:hypothetical protein
MSSHPNQLLVSSEGVLRYKPNEIVRFLLDTHPDYNLKQLENLDFSEEDRQQFAQLIGSVVAWEQPPRI